MTTLATHRLTTPARVQQLDDDGGSRRVASQAAFEQVFPAVPRNTVRQRLATIRETPANEAYLRRLEDNWYYLWMKHKDTPLLPDDDDTSPSNFDLISHLEFLRANVDKNALYALLLLMV